MKTPALFVLAMLMTASIASAGSLHDIAVKDIDGRETSLTAYKDKVLLVVNVASKCGLTPQYKALEAIHEKYAAKGFTVLGFPCNQFNGQEPGTNEQIKEFCTTEYGVTFPMFEKMDVKGSKRHPLYTALTGEASPFPGDIQWNFTKFLVDKDGKILKRFEPKTLPDSPEVIAAIESALAAN